MESKRVYFHPPKFNMLEKLLGDHGPVSEISDAVNKARETAASPTKKRSTLAPLMDTISNILGLSDYKENKNDGVKLSSSQNFLRANLVEMQRRNGTLVGLNVAIDCKGANLNSEQDHSRIVRRTSSPFLSPGTSSTSHDLNFDETLTSERVFDVEEVSNFELYPEHEEDADSVNSDASSISTESESNQSFVSVYTNPKYGSVQREQFPTIRGGEPLEQRSDIVFLMMNSSQRLQTCRNSQRPVQSIQDRLTDELSISTPVQALSFEFILSPVISNAELSVVDESEMGLEEVAQDEEDEEGNPLQMAREYNLRLNDREKLGTILAKNVCETMDVCSSGGAGDNGIVRNIPCDSWIALPLRMLPGNMVPYGLVIFVPFVLALIALVAAFFLTRVNY